MIASVDNGLYAARMAGGSVNPATGEFKVDSKEPSRAFAEQASTENRFKQLAKLDPAKAEAMVVEADKRFKAKYELYTKLAGIAKKD